METPQAPVHPPAYGAPPRRGVPGWVWALIACGCLAIFGFVAILAAILFPVFAQAREKAREVSCLSNLKQTALASSMYAQDYDQAYPPADRWIDVTFPYTKREVVYHCPSVAQNGPDSYGYSFDTDLVGKKVSDVADPTQEVMIFDSTNLARNASDAGTSLPNPPRHLGGNNVVFVNGSARNMKGLTAPGTATP